MTDPRDADGSSSELDLSLLDGFSFACRPDCGLCCFSSPRLEGTDEERLRLMVPSLRVIAREGERCIASRPDGGACELLDHLRCRAHNARPAPCREFPLSIHIGTRIQATVVLSCPGLSVSPLLERKGGRSAPSRFDGLETELASARDRLVPVAARLRVEATRRQRKIARELAAQGRWVDDEEVRRKLSHRPLSPGADEYFPDELPSAVEGLEPLPMYFDGRDGPVALAQGGGGWEALELMAEGGSKPLGEAVPPEQPPDLTEDGRALLEGYLRYWLARDCFLAAVHLDMERVPEGTVVETALEELHAIGSDVLARGAVRAQLRGDAGARLDREGVERGIRATDQDWLDRPTWGRRL